MRKVNFTNFLAFFVVTICLGYFYYISSKRFPVALLKDVSDIKIAMINITMLVIGYYFGASKKDKKDETPTP